MAMTEEIYTVAEVFAQAGEAGREALRQLCGAAEVTLTAELRRGILPDDCRGSFVCAAAMLAASHYIAARAQNGRFTVGDVSVLETGAESAEALRTQAGLLMRPFCRGELAFLGVRA